MKRPPQRKKRRSVAIPTASMGDIAFLLIIFFWPRGMFGRTWERTKCLRHPTNPAAS